MRPAGPALVLIANAAWGCAVEPTLPGDRTPLDGAAGGAAPGDAPDTAEHPDSGQQPDSGTPSPPLPTLDNPGFEAELRGWSMLDGACQVTGSHLGLGAAEGASFLWGGSHLDGTCVVGQTLSLAEHAAIVDDRRLGVDVDVLVASRMVEGAFDDQPRLRLVWLGEAGEALGRLETLIGSGAEWHVRGASGLVPSGTRAVRVELESRLRRIPDNDGMIDDVQLAFRPVEPVAPAITRQPMLQDHRQDAMRVLWETDGNLAQPAVAFGPSGAGFTQRVDDVRTIEVDADHHVHVADLVGLSAGTSWQYRVENGTTLGPIHDFQTAPADDAPVRISWMADNQEGATVFARHIRHLTARDPDLLFVAGDLVSDMHALDEWRDFWWAPLEEEAFGSRVPVLIARGNHDRHHPYAYAYTAMPEREDLYSFRYGPVFVVVLDTQQPMSNQPPDLDQRHYLESALASDAARSADFRVVVFHQAPFSNVRQDASDGNQGVRDAWLDVIVAGGVELVIAGHYHSYQRGFLDGVTHVVVGGGGSALLVGPDEELWEHMTLWEKAWHYTVMDVEDGHLVWSTYDLDDVLIDRFELEGGPVE